VEFQLHQGPRYGKWMSVVQWRKGADLIDAAMWVDGDAHIAGLVNLMDCASFSSMYLPTLALNLTVSSVAIILY